MNSSLISKLEKAKAAWEICFMLSTQDDKLEPGFLLMWNLLLIKKVWNKLVHTFSWNYSLSAAVCLVGRKHKVSSNEALSQASTGH